MAHPLAGKSPDPSMLIDVDRLRARYYDESPDVGRPEERVAFGTSGHRGSAARRSFNEGHILAVAQAVCDYRAREGIAGPLFLGMDSHALSPPAHATTLEVLVANGVDVHRAEGDQVTPTPVISHAILTANRAAGNAQADGIVVTPSHNPPEDGGIKYNAPHGGPADETATRWIEDRANALLRAGLGEVRRVSAQKAASGSTARDFIAPYVADLAAVLDIDAIRASGVRIGVDPLGGASLPYWGAIAERLGLAITVVNPRLDPTFAFMAVDHDGKLRMDCSSPYAMTPLVALRDKFDIAVGNDPDADRHGIVTRSSGLMQPNHYLAVAIGHLFTTRDWPDAAVGKTLVSSLMIDRVTADLGRRLVRGAGRVQVVRGRPGRRLARLRRRGERRGVVPAPRPDRVVDRQGRHHPGPAGRRDPGAHRVRIPVSITGRSRRSTARRTIRALTWRPRRPRRRCSRSSRPMRSRVTRWPTSRSRQS